MSAPKSPSALIPEGAQPATAPFLEGIFEDWYFYEVYITRPVLASPITEDGWLIGAIRHKALKRKSVSEALLYGYDSDTGLIILPYAFRATVQHTMAPNPENPQAPPMPQVAISVKFLSEIAVGIGSIAYACPLTEGGRDYGDMALGVIRQSMSKIERPLIRMPPDVGKKIN